MALIKGNALISKLTLETNQKQDSAENLYDPFINKEQYELAKDMCHGRKLPTNSMLEAHAMEQKLYLKPGIGFRSIREFHNKLTSLQTDGEWQMRELTHTENAADWVPTSIPFYYHDTLQALKSIVANSRIAQHCKWAPERFYDGENRRVYTDISSGNCWWRHQVALASIMVNY